MLMLVLRSWSPPGGIKFKVKLIERVSAPHTWNGLVQRATLRRPPRRRHQQDFRLRKAARSSGEGRSAAGSRQLRIRKKKPTNPDFLSRRCVKRIVATIGLKKKKKRQKNKTRVTFRHPPVPVRVIMNTPMAAAARWSAAADCSGH